MSLVRLGDIAEQVRGVAYPKQDISEIPADDHVPILRANNVTEYGLNISDTLHIKSNHVSARQMLRFGDIVITASSGSISVVGRAAQLNVDFSGTFGAFCKVVRPGPRVHNRYLGHFFQTKEYRQKMSSLAAGANINNLKNEHLDDLQIPLPPLDEQRRIAAILDQADALRRKRREALELLEKLRRSAFDNIFGDPSTNPKNWPVGRISDVTESTQYGTSSKAGEIGNFPILRMGNLTVNGGWKLHDMKFIEFAERDVDKYTVTKGDILFNRTNSPDLVGKTAVFREEKPFGFAGYLVRLRLNERAKPEYVAGYLNSSHGKATLRGMCKSIIGMANINAKELVSIPLMLPPIELQKSFSVIVEQSLKAEKSQSAHLEEMDVFFASLQHRAFRGEL